MTQDKTKRKLVAVVHADVKGYSRLMSEDDEYTVRTLASNRGEMYKLAELHDGHVVDTAGDGFLIEFPSVVDAVKFSVDFQRGMKKRNAEIPENRKMEFRIGVNIGDVIHDGGTIHGDGVNVAARLEGLADPGGICISGAAYDQVEKRLDLDYEYTGEKTVKNIAKPVRTYKLLIDSDRTTKHKESLSKPERTSWRRTYLIAVAAVIVAVISVGIYYFYFHSAKPSIRSVLDEAPAPPMPDKPSIAVLPFSNMSGDPKQEYFSDGITEEIITGLSKMPKLFVIARNSSFTFKGKAVSVQEVGRKLGVRYVLEGSVRKAGDKVRITAQLIDAQTGGHVWAERYDRELKDIFAIQDEVTRNIMVAMQVKLTSGEQARLSDERDRTDSMEAFEKVVLGREYARVYDKEGNLMAQQLYREAIALDPTYAAPHAALAIAKFRAVVWRWSKSPAEDVRDAYKLATRAIDLNDFLDSGHYALGIVYLAMRQHDKAIAEGERAVELSPNGANAHYYLGVVLNFAGRPKEALALINKAIRLNPMPPGTYYCSLGMAHRELNQYEKAIVACKKGIHIHPDNTFCWANLTCTYSLAGREVEARKAAAEILKRDPKFSVAYFAKKMPFRNPASIKRAVDALRNAGLK